MSDPQRVVAIIPARGGSKRLPRKNVLLLQGAPLIAWTISAALKSSRVDTVVVSSDDDEILDIASRYNVYLRKRPDVLASDTARSIDVIRDALEFLDHSGRHFDTAVLLQPTSPLRIASDIEDALRLFREGGGASVVSVTELGYPSEWVGQVQDDGSMLEFAVLEGRASAPPLLRYRLNGAVYVFSVPHFKAWGNYYTARCIAHIMPKERSVDVDTLTDLQYCEFLLTKNTLTEIDSGCAGAGVPSPSNEN